MLEFDLRESAKIIRNLQQIERSASAIRKQIENKLKPRQEGPRKCCCLYITLRVRKKPSRQLSFESVSDNEYSAAATTAESTTQAAYTPAPVVNQPYASASGAEYANFARNEHQVERVRTQGF